MEQQQHGVPSSLPGPGSSGATSQPPAASTGSSTPQFSPGGLGTSNGAAIDATEDLSRALRGAGNTIAAAPTSGSGNPSGNSTNDIIRAITARINEVSDGLEQAINQYRATHPMAGSSSGDGSSNAQDPDGYVLEVRPVADGSQMDGAAIVGTASTNYIQIGCIDNKRVTIKGCGLLRDEDMAPPPTSTVRKRILFKDGTSQIITLFPSNRCRAGRFTVDFVQNALAETTANANDNCNESRAGDANASCAGNRSRSGSPRGGRRNRSRSPCRRRRCSRSRQN